MKRTVSVFAMLLIATASFGFMLLNRTMNEAKNLELEIIEQSPSNVELVVINESNTEQWN